MPQLAEVGLTSEQAARLLAENGPNHLPVQRPTPAWRRLAAEMVHFFALLFWVAGGLAFVAGLPQLGIAIFGVNGFVIGPVIAAMFMAAWDIFSASRSGIQIDRTGH